MSVTIRDVAKAAEVSPSTVSKVINKSPLISQKTTDHVNSIIEQMQYVPNTRARNFAKQETKSVVFLTLFERHMALLDPYIFEILSGAEQVVKRSGFYINYISASSIDEAYEIVKKIVVEKSSDGIIIHGYAVSPKITTLLMEKRFPHILIGNPAFESSSCWVDINNVIAGEIAARYLFDCGVKKLAFIGGKKADTISQMRLQGIKKFAVNNQLPLWHYNVNDEDLITEAGYASAKEALSGKEPPDGIICENSLFAGSVVKAIHEAKLSIPNDISLICFDNYPFSFFVDPLPTVVDIDVFALGSEAARYLLKKIKNPNFNIQGYISLPTIIERDSTKKKTHPSRQE
jgi:DNA-binding LacI/PurR family transcriptional regulator